MRRHWRKLLIGLAIIFAAAGLCLSAGVTVLWTGWAITDARATATTLYWARLSAYPKSADDITIKVEGSAFTRAFRTSFTAPANEIEQWLKDSEGTRGLTPTMPTPHTRHFDITPAGGAIRAEVDVDDSTHRVRVYACWS